MHAQEAVDEPEREANSGRATLASRGSWARFVMAGCLISVLPTLAVCVGIFGPRPMPEWGVMPRLAFAAILLVLILLGYVLLLRYPQTTVQLRRNLQRIASGELPEGVHLAQDENDIAAIEKYLNAILFQARWKVSTIEHQRESLLYAERQRVMIESLGAACHHIGQPVTALVMQLDLLKTHAGSEEQRKKIDDCIATAEAMGEILAKLRRASQYRSEPYIVSETSSSPDRRIIAF